MAITTGGPAPSVRRRYELDGLSPHERQLAAEVNELLDALEGAEERERTLACEIERGRETIQESHAGYARREKLAALGETVSGLAHELNNRLLPITMYSDSLLSGRLPARETKHVRAIAAAAEGVRGIVESLLGFARRTKPCKVPVKLSEILAGTISVVKYSLQRDGVLLRTSFDPELPDTMADPLQVERVMLNLIKNARDAIVERGAGQSGYIQISTSRDGDYLRVCVRDNGCGIPSRNLPRILEPFFTTKAPGAGTGLGLSLCYGIMFEHGGDIQVASKPGDTTFTLRFPLVKVVADEASKSGPIAQPLDDGTRLSVLIVDDDESILQLMHDVLDAHMSVDTAASGIEAIQKLSRSDYDVILSDMRMPGLGGRDIYAWLRDHRPGSERKLVFATGDTFDPGTVRFVEETGIPCVAKPFSLKTIVRAIRGVRAAWQARETTVGEGVAQ